MQIVSRQKDNRENNLSKKGEREKRVLTIAADLMAYLLKSRHGGKGGITLDEDRGQEQVVFKKINVRKNKKKVSLLKKRR